MIKLFDDFKAYKVGVKGVNEKTIDQYFTRINGFLELYNITTDKDLIAVTANMVTNWLVELSKKGNAETSRNVKLTAIKEIFKYLDEEKELDIDRKILRIPNAKVPYRESKYMDELTYRDFIYHINNLRVKAMVITFWHTGMRFSEMTSITLEDYYNYINGNIPYISIIGKGNKERKIYLSEECKKSINRYIERKRKHIVKKTGTNCNLLFLSNNGNAVRKTSFNESLKHYAKATGIPWYREMSPHKLRHSFATHKAKTHNIKAVQKALGHSSLSTTSRYIHTNEEETRRMMEDDEW